MPTSESRAFSTNDVQTLWAELMVEELVRNGVDTFFVAPGSRSTPLTVAVAEHPDARVVLHVDERGNAFAALGAGRATRRPAGWITTSGTAVANGYPAVVEASVDSVPMILLTADRPPERRDTGANQTIDQVKFFGDYVRWQSDVPTPTRTVDPAFVLTTVDQAIHRAQRAPAGPVHLNCAFRKPLEPGSRGTSISLPDVICDWAEQETPFTTYPRSVMQPGTDELRVLVDALERRPTGIIVTGRLDRVAEARAALQLAKTLEWPLLPDLTSHLRLGTHDDDVRVGYGDLALTAEQFRDDHRPDMVLQFGGRFTSKRLRHFLRDRRPSMWAVVRPDPSRIDPDHRITHHVEASVVPFVEALIDEWNEPADVEQETRSAWREADARARAVVGGHVEEAGLTEPTVAAVLTQEIPADHALVAGSSMPIRDLNRHASTEGAAVPAYANRGASGIDGTVATAAGVARGTDCPVTLLIGDIALWHDLNSLALLDDRPVVVVVVNNDGGGIFHFLPIREHETVFEPYFTTPQGRSFEAAAETFGLEYTRPSSTSELRTAYSEACTAMTPTIIEVQTDRDENRRVHEDLERAVAAAIDQRN